MQPPLTGRLGRGAMSLGTRFGGDARGMVRSRDGAMQYPQQLFRPVHNPYHAKIPQKAMDPPLNDQRRMQPIKTCLCNRCEARRPQQPCLQLCMALPCLGHVPNPTTPERALLVPTARLCELHTKHTSCIACTLLLLASSNTHAVSCSVPTHHGCPSKDTAAVDCWKRLPVLQLGHRPLSPTAVHTQSGTAPPLRTQHQGLADQACMLSGSLQDGMGTKSADC